MFLGKIDILEGEKRCMGSRRVCVSGILQTICCFCSQHYSICGLTTSQTKKNEDHAMKATVPWGEVYVRLHNLMSGRQRSSGFKILDSELNRVKGF